MKPHIREYLELLSIVRIIMNIACNKRAYFIVLYFHYLALLSHYDFMCPLLTKYYRHYRACHD